MSLLDAIKRTPGNIVGGPVDLANLITGALAGKGISGLAPAPAGGSNWINSKFGLEAPKTLSDQTAEALLGMATPSGVAKGAVLGLSPLVASLVAGTKGVKAGANLGKEAGALLLHGGPAPVVKYDPLRSMNQVQGAGLYTTNKLGVPAKFATSNPTKSGYVSVFDFPDELLAKTLKLTDRPLQKSGAAAQSELANLVALHPELRNEIKALIKQFGSSDALTGERLHQALRKSTGGIQPANDALAAAGIPGKTWQYAVDRPAEMATVVFPEYADKLKPIDQIPITNTIQDFTRVSQLLKSMKGGTP